MADLKIALEDLEAETASRRGRGAGPCTRAVAMGMGGVAADRACRWLRRMADLAPRANRWRRCEPPRSRRFPGQELYPSLSPDGNHVVFTWTGPKQDNTDIYVQQIGAGSPLRLTTDPKSDYNPVWSPDGRWIAFLRGDPATPLARSDREVRLIPPLGGPERKLADVRVQEITVNPVYLAWCPDSSCVIVTDTRWRRKA